MLFPDRGDAMTADESKALKKGTIVYWQGDASDSGIVTHISWDAASITWKNGHAARVHHGDMREILREQSATTRSRDG